LKRRKTNMTETNEVTETWYEKKERVTNAADMLAGALEILTEAAAVKWETGTVDDQGLPIIRIILCDDGRLIGLGPRFQIQGSPVLQAEVKKQIEEHMRRRVKAFAQQAACWIRENMPCPCGTLDEIRKQRTDIMIEIESQFRAEAEDGFFREPPF
jgi:hypothetical protein